MKFIKLFKSHDEYNSSELTSLNVAYDGEHLHFQNLTETNFTPIFVIFNQDYSTILYQKEISNNYTTNFTISLNEITNDGAILTAESPAIISNETDTFNFIVSSEELDEVFPVECSDEGEHVIIDDALINELPVLAPYKGKRWTTTYHTEITPNPTPNFNTDDPQYDTFDELFN